MTLRWRVSVSERVGSGGKREADVSGVTSVEPSGFFNKSREPFSGTAVAPMVRNFWDENDGSEKDLSLELIP